MSLYRDQGVALRHYKLGEADRIVVFMTAGHGKVRAVAKGIRKTKSRFGSRLEPPTNVNLLFYEGRGELDIVSQAEAIDHFRPIRDDLARMTDAMSMLEAVDQTAQERQPDARLYQMLVAALRTLAERDRRSPLLVAAFYWKLLSMEGYGPILDRCASCEAPASVGVALVAFDLGHGGALCRDCRVGMPVTPEALALLSRILGGGLAGALQEPDSALTSEVAVLATHSMEQHLERRLRAVHALERG
ncbi:MAG TPA: DNA repair protein RecO [Acidimicrobiales bacterium]|nr:DNA repair protein RecO [Acidimicrobiales bacterium]